MPHPKITNYLQYWNALLCSKYYFQFFQFFSKKGNRPKMMKIFFKNLALIKQNTGCSPIFVIQSALYNFRHFVRFEVKRFGRKKFHNAVFLPIEQRHKHALKFLYHQIFKSKQRKTKLPSKIDISLGYFILSLFYRIGQFTKKYLQYYHSNYKELKSNRKYFFLKFSKKKLKIKKKDIYKSFVDKKKRKKTSKKNKSDLVKLLKDKRIVTNREKKNLLSLSHVIKKNFKSLPKWDKYKKKKFSKNKKRKKRLPTVFSKSYLILGRKKKLRVDLRNFKKIRKVIHFQNKISTLSHSWIARRSTSGVLPISFANWIRKNRILKTSQTYYTTLKSIKDFDTKHKEIEEEYGLKINNTFNLLKNIAVSKFTFSELQKKMKKLNKNGRELDFRNRKKNVRNVLRILLKMLYSNKFLYQFIKKQIGSNVTSNYQVVLHKRMKNIYFDIVKRAKLIFLHKNYRTIVLESKTLKDVKKLSSAMKNLNKKLSLHLNLLTKVYRKNDNNGVRNYVKKINFHQKFYNKKSPVFTNYQYESSNKVMEVLKENSLYHDEIDETFKFEYLNWNFKNYSQKLFDFYCYRKNNEGSFNNYIYKNSTSDVIEKISNGVYSSKNFTNLDLFLTKSFLNIL